MLRGALIMLFPKMQGLIDLLVKAYGDKKLEQDINTYNFNNIYNVIIKQFDKQKIKYLTVKCSLKERYMGTIKKLLVNNKKYNVPLCEDELHYDDLIVNVECSEYQNYQQINYKDLYLVYKISLSEYLYGGNVKLEYFDEIINIPFPSQVDLVPIIILKNKGIPKYMSKVRGNLFIHLKIDGINTGEDSFKHLVKEAIEMLF